MFLDERFDCFHPKGLKLIGFIIFLLSVLLLSSCSDMGERDNVLDPSADNYVVYKDIFSSSSRMNIASSSSRNSVIHVYSSSSEFVIILSSSGKNVESSLGKCTTAIADSVGKVDSTYYICKSKNWVEASALEYDTYKWNAGKDGDSKIGSVNADNCYVYENKTWRRGNTSDCTLKLRGCTKLRQDTIGIGSDKVWYICDSSSWRKATDIEKDTYQYQCTIDGEGKNVYKEGDLVYGLEKTKTRYACENGKWRDTKTGEEQVGKACTAKLQGIILRDTLVCDANNWREVVFYDYPIDKDWTNPNLIYGKLVDEREGRTYKTIKINGITVMAENLKYADSLKNPYLKGNSWCYNNDSINCLKGGRYYTWTAAMDIDSKWQGGSAFSVENLIQTPHRGLCPKGWHIPTSEEWESIFGNVVDVSQLAVGIARWTNATNASGFSALPAGYFDGGFFHDPYNAAMGDLGYAAYFWSATEMSSYNNSFYWYLTDKITGNTTGLRGPETGPTIKSCGYSVRCFKDVE